MILSARCCVAFSRKSPSNNATACGLPRRQASPNAPQRNSSRTIKQRPGNDQALYAPARQRVKFARSDHLPAPVGLVALTPFPSSDNGLKTTHTRRQFAGGAPGKQSAGGDPFLQQRQMLRDLRQCQMTGIQHRRQFSTNVRRRLSGAFNMPPFVHV